MNVLIIHQFYCFGPSLMRKLCSWVAHCVDWQWTQHPTVSIPEGSFSLASLGGLPTDLPPCAIFSLWLQTLLFFLFSYEWAAARTCRGRVVLCDCSRRRRALPLPPLVLPHTLCIVLPRTLQGLACGGGIQGVCRLHVRALADNTPQPCYGIQSFRIFHLFNFLPFNFLMQT